MAVRDEIREQQKKLKGQGFKAPLGYFWECYKIHTLVAVFVIIFISVLIRDISGRKPYALYAMMINIRGIDIQEYIQNDFYNYAGIDSSKEAVLVDTSASFSLANLDNSSVATSEKIMAVMAAKDLDVIVADRNTFGHYSALDTYMDLREVFDKKTLDALSEKNMIFYVDRPYVEYLSSDEYSDYIVSGKFDENNKYAVMADEYEKTFIYPEVDVSDMEDPIPVGVILSSSKVLTESGAVTESAPIAGITVSTQRLDMSREFVEYLMNDK